METTAKATATIISPRLNRLKEKVLNYPPSICPERALLVTKYFKQKENGKKPMVIQKAEALAYILDQKTVRIYEDELIVGTTTSKRVAGPIFPELHGLPVMEDLFSFSDRKINPLKIHKHEKTKLLTEVVPFWLTRFLGYKAMNGLDLIKFVTDQLNPKFYLINETGGIGHLIPDHERVLERGLDGIKEDIRVKLNEAGLSESARNQYEAMIISCDGIINYAHKYAEKAEGLAKTENDPGRKAELLTIAKNLKHAPQKPAETFHQAIQVVWLMHTAVFIEGLDNGISFGRMDQYLYPFYRRDLINGTITKDKAKELIGCLGIKSSEIIPVFSSKISECHGGFLSGQAITLAGTDEEGNDLTNELTFMMLELMDEVRLRQPNYHARIHDGSPKPYIDKIMSNLVKGVNSPALYNDKVIISSLKKAGYSDADSNAYATLGCVELLSAGKTFGSTDAALVNIPICLEMALNEGRLFGDLMRKGTETKPVDDFKNIDEVKAAFKTQLQFVIDRLVKVLEPIEIANRDFHPTPLTSVVTQGCIESGKDVTSGGAIYNFSGVQGVGVTDVGDSLYAIDQLVFQKKKIKLSELVNALKTNFKGKEKLRMELHNLPKFGNDMEDVDALSRWVTDTYYDSFNGKMNTRGGKFVAGFYSTTTHYSFGKMTGALPNGREKGEPFSSGIAPMNGADVLGPTAMFNSITALDFERAHNGVNVNAKFDTATLKGEHGKMILESLLLTYFKKGGMQVQLNVLDTEMLKDAKIHPEKYPNLLVRVSGYSAYFNDLSPAMKDEIINRSCLNT
ncbi:MAG: formate C-acetyltransferase/glycerol dehydratase family glycyl radical enzyme [Flavobacteriales bacterium]|nr:formate C-acetyltransferase/glycerol dehydratase family glycyl radical enzyme [Flavobacteriales bacterium]